MLAHLQEWLNLVVRMVHVIAAIMWIGDSFLFMFLDKSLEPGSPTKPPREGAVMGEMWMTHGGGFYELVKRKSLSHEEMPKTLHWFKWESYMTWLSGFTLLGVVYYMSGGAYLVDPTVSAITPSQAIFLSLGLLAVGWVVYDVLCNVLAAYTKVLAAICFTLVVGIAYGLSLVLSQRAMFIHVGALMATCMSGNVFFRIIPGQRRMMADTLAKRPVDTSFGVKAKTRSTHNHYITLPVVLMMLSNHFPSLYGHRHSWVILGLMFVFGMGVKFIMNFKSKSHPAVILLTVLSLAGIIYMTGPKSIANASPQLTSGSRVPYSLVHTIVQERCVTCHAAKPANGTYVVAAAGLNLQRPELVKLFAPRIYLWAVETKKMPLNNMTGITDGERDLLGRWIHQGANLGSLDETIAPELLAERSRTGAPTGPVLEPSAEAKQIYSTRCFSCHGNAGDGGGPAAAGLEPKPRNFKDAAWQKETSDDNLAKVIIGGGRAVGKNALMPSSPELGAKPEVVKELVKLVRGFGGGT